MKQKIVGYGELLLRLTPVEYGGLIEQSDALKMAYAGAEANIICDLAILGHKTAFITALPENSLGKKANQFLQGFGVATASVIWNKGRLGTYYIEHGSSIRGSRVTYDREDSIITKTKISDKQWDAFFTETAIFVLTGITPALSQTCRDNIKTALELCKSKGIKVVFDLNYRRSLWEKQEARRSFDSILPFVDVLCANVGSAYDVFDVKTTNIDDYDSLTTATKEASVALSELGDFECIAMSMRLQSNANNNELGGMIRKGNDYCFSESIPTNIIDRLGGGDAFAAATIHGILKNWQAYDIVNFATAAFAMSQTIHGDINYFTEEELLKVASGSLNGYVQR